MGLRWFFVLCFVSYTYDFGIRVTPTKSKNSKHEEFQDDHPVQAKESQIKEFSHKRKKSFYIGTETALEDSKKKNRKEFYCLKERRTNDFHTNIFVEYILLFVGYSSNSCEGDNTNSTEKYF